MWKTAAAIVLSLATLTFNSPGGAEGTVAPRVRDGEAGAPESRLVVPFVFAEVIGKVGSYTIAEIPGASDCDESLTERPGDKLPMTLPSLVGLLFEGTGAYIGRLDVWGGEGSEVRFRGRVVAGGVSVTAAPGGRLCFKKSNGSWVYLCGRGHVQHSQDGRIVEMELGRNRTVEHCLRLLSASDPLLREGAARDLGRLTTDPVAHRVLSGILPLLRDPVPGVRRGAALALGLIGRQDCIPALQAAMTAEKDELTKEFLAQALARCTKNGAVSEPVASTQ